jgi:hypothetical protein
VHIDAPCLDCAEPVAVEMQDGKVLQAEPKEMIGYVAVPFRKWFENIPYA